MKNLIAKDTFLFFQEHLVVLRCYNIEPKNTINRIKTAISYLQKYSRMSNRFKKQDFLNTLIFLLYGHEKFKNNCNS